jgi:hypothetical protein
MGLARLMSSRMSSPPTTIVPTPGSSVRTNRKEYHRTIDAFTVARSRRLREFIEAHLAKPPSLGVRPYRRPPATLLKKLGSARGSDLDVGGRVSTALGERRHRGGFAAVKRGSYAFPAEGRTTTGPGR